MKTLYRPLRLMFGRDGLIPFNLEDLKMALVVTRREVQDSLRDWRIMVPIVVLTLFFPLLMNFTARRLLNFVSDYGAEIVGTQLIPFLLLVVGFFPTSFSLVIALETFVGEKERNSLETLLATPLTNRQLYLGKVLASVFPPLFSSYLGIAVYLLGLFISIGWTPSPLLMLQTLLITFIQGIVMVAGAVIVSSQTTSARAANLLASFIIVPMALLLQFEAVVMFWGNHAGMWWLILGLIVVAVVLVRMGVHVFNREELLGRDIDHIRLSWIFTRFWNRFSGREAATGRFPTPLVWYRGTLSLLPTLRRPFLVTVVGFAGAVALGIYLAHRYPFPPQVQAALAGFDRMDNLAGLQSLLSRLPLTIFLHNLRVIALASLLGMFTFGVLGFLIFMLPWAFISFVASQLAQAGQNPLAFLLATIAPHATVELPALMVVTAAVLRWQTALIAPAPGQTVSESWLDAAADFTRLMLGVAAPLLLIAAFVEGYVTPLVVLAVYGG